MIKSKYIYFFVLILINGFYLQLAAKANMDELEDFFSKLHENEKFQSGMLFGAGATICELNALDLITLNIAKSFRENSIQDDGYLAQESFDLGVKFIKPYLDGDYCYGL